MHVATVGMVCGCSLSLLLVDSLNVLVGSVLPTNGEQLPHEHWAAARTQTRGMQGLCGPLEGTGGG